MTTRIDCVATLEESSHRCAMQMTEIACACITAAGRFAMALCGGSTPRRLYQILAEESCRSRIDWERVFLFWGDERCVAPGHPQSNFRLVKETLLDHIAIPAENVFPMPGKMRVEEAARQYEKTLRKFFGFAEMDSGLPCFDLILLGMGEDGHSASLFPGSEVLSERRRWVVPVLPPSRVSPAVPRLTLTLPVIQRAAHRFFLVAGKAKEKTAAAVLHRKSQAVNYPAFLIDPLGECRWFLSEVDCSLFAHIQTKEMT
ncbi:MAG: 6-phosphogluconolactonase [Desulfuromonadaceae bacterium]|nr:6-phosphogluconolactonase [Desulfuromonadaceae bacterium]